MFSEKDILEFQNAIEKLSNENEGSNPDLKLEKPKDNEKLTL